MELNQNQKQLLVDIQRKLGQGDIKAISEKAGFSREYVGRVLNLSNNIFHEDIVTAAVAVIAAREQRAIQITKKLLTKLTA